jgi:PAS domain S-box-containing protein
MSAHYNESRFPTWTEADRLAALRSLEILDTDPETAFDDLATLAARMCDAPIAIIVFIDEGRQWFKSTIGLGVRETPLDNLICTHAIVQPGLFVVPDTTTDPHFSSNPLATGEPSLRFYAGARLETDAGLPLGALCVLDSKPRPEGITKEQGETLLALARAVMSQLKLRQANKTLEERQREREALVDALPQMIWSARADGRDDYCNRRWYVFTGAEPSPLPSEDWINFVHPEDQNRTEALWQHALRTGEPYEDEYRLRHHSGEYRWVLSRGVPVRDPEGTTRWLGTNTDIHALKQAEQALARSEERYRALIEAGSPIIWRAAPDGSILEGWGWEAFGGQAPQAYKGRGWLNGVHPDDVDRIVGAWHEALASGRPGTIEYRVRRQNGEYRWVAARGVPLLDTDGAVQEWVGTITDIHDRKQAEEALRASEERLRLALQAGRMFAWEHDLKTNHVTRSDNALDLIGQGSGPLTDFLKRVDPKHRARRKRFAQHLEKKGFGATEFRYVRSSRRQGLVVGLARREGRAGSRHRRGVRHHGAQSG